MQIFSGPGVLALEDGEEDAELEGVDHPGDRVKLLRVPFVSAAETAKGQYQESIL
jgi:hypothetical protein